MRKTKKLDGNYKSYKKKMLTSGECSPELPSLYPILICGKGLDVLLPLAWIRMSKKGRTLSGKDIFSKGHYPEWTPSRMDTIPKSTLAIASSLFMPKPSIGCIFQGSCPFWIESIRDDVLSGLSSDTLDLTVIALSRVPSI